MIPIFIALLFSQFVGGAEIQCPQTGSQERDIFQLYQSSFYSSNVYKKGSCPTNIWKFLKVLELCQIPTSEMEVLYITENNLNVYLDQGRGGAERWYFHVILSWKNWIFDFDYTNEPLVPKKQSYFKQGLATQAQTQWKDLQLRRIPGESYTHKYNIENTADFGFYYWLLPERSSFPEVSIPDYLSE